MPYRIIVFLFFIFSLTALSTTLYGQKQTITFKGIVYDFDTNQPVPGVTVSTQNKKFQTFTDTTGAFTLELPVDDYTLVFTYVGYQKKESQIFISDKASDKFFIKKNQVYELQEVVVESRRKDASVRDLQMSVAKINLSQLKKTPLIFGEADVLRALTLQPGIITGGETVSSYYVRGGDADQNLILIDGAPIFNVAHLLGFYSGINADAIQNLEFYKAGIPAELGSRLSSIMLLNVKTGNTDTFRYNGGIGLISSRFMLNGPLIKKKLTVMASGRVAYPKVMMNLGPGDVKNSNAFYYDAIAKLSYTPNDKNRINVTFYNSFDKYQFPGDTSYSWKNIIGSFQWKSSIGKNFTSVLSANYSKYSSFINGLSDNNGFKLQTGIQQQEGKAVFTYNIAASQKISIGGGLIHYTISPGQLIPKEATSSIVPKKIEEENANEASAFLSTENKITKFLDIQLGVRLTDYQYKGAKSVFIYGANEPRTVESITDTIKYTGGQNIKEYKGVEPRILMRVLLNSSTSIKLSYNKTRQYLHLITNSTSVTPVDYWKLSDAYIIPENADQYAIGFFKNFQDNNFETSLEGYYKKINNTIEYKNGADLSLNPALETQVLPAEGYAYGAELSVKKNIGIITGNASYTYSRVFTRVKAPFVNDQVNEGEYFPGNADRPHNFIVAASVRLTKGWIFSSNFVYTTGRPATYPDGSYIINGNIVTNYSVRNQDRLPDYNRLDVSFAYDSRRYPQQRKYSIINFSFYNVYMRKNVYSVYFKREGTRIHAYQLSIIGSIIPSISWNFNF